MDTVPSLDRGLGMRCPRDLEFLDVGDPMCSWCWGFSPLAPHDTRRWVARLHRAFYVEGTDSEDHVEALAELAREFGSHVTVAPNPALPEPFVATAWTRHMELPEADVDRARDFAIAFRERGPERVACDV